MHQNGVGLVMFRLATEAESYLKRQKVAETQQKHDDKVRALQNATGC